ncbi:hypothetical protein [Rhizobium sp. CC-YZS058]|uniref:hypothetical protein n=1 Tax=Rhizobium sp. CC-YZS058 TaxID=3042153 RepID=UPI002B05F634|nr:hypothetical protein [Rhizobium sp. CC-YZS058]MEA3535177.1 hypothetical protein [Rhizobium sp. CC-YZS058]
MAMRDHLRQLTLCLPSHRPLSAARSSIESLLRFGEETGCRMVISDNSGDPEKREAFEGRSPHLIYLVPEGDDPLDNLTTALSAVETEFVMPMGDDDWIRTGEGVALPDLSTIAPDVAVIRPETEIWAEGRVVDINRFTIDGSSAEARMLDYVRKAPATNALYYSAFRSRIFLPLMQSFAAGHPTRGGYCDWAVMFTLLACGRAIHAPGILYRYDLGRWTSSVSLQESKRSLFAAAGLPAEAENYSALLTFLDLYTLLSIRALPLGAQERDQALGASLSVSLGAFVAAVRARPCDYDEVAVYLTELLAEETELNGIFALALMIADCLQPGLRERYVRFFQAVSAG